MQKQLTATAKPKPEWMIYFLLWKVIFVFANTQVNNARICQKPLKKNKRSLICWKFLCSNVKTSTVAALSPATVNYDEIIGTLKYANQVRDIKNVAKIDEKSS